ncbi:hypothetical protein DL763_008750 [Monosporascus cannonballus]|nr:hypothetical protein DL763_008750 [Monosporascus cannonballus]
MLRNATFSPFHGSRLENITSAEAGLVTMMDQAKSKTIKENPIGKALNGFLISFNLICEGRNISYSPDALVQLGQEDVQDLASSLLSALQILPVTRLLPSKTNRGALRSDLLRLISAVASDNFDFDRIRPLLNAVLANSPDDEIWDQVYNTVTESTPPPRPIASSLQQTPWLHNTSSFANSSEYRKYMDDVLKEELGPIVQGRLR